MDKTNKNIPHEEQATKWLKEVGWLQNPFTLNIIPSIFVGFEPQRRDIENHLQLGHKFAFISGGPGTGKTNFLKNLESSLELKYHVVYFPKPPPKEEVLESLINEFPPSLFDRVFRKKYTMSTLHEFIKKRMKKPVLLLVDEAHEADTEVLMWLRTWVDQVDGLHAIFAGLDMFEEKLRQELETLATRINTKVVLEALSEEQTRSLIKNRIEHFKGTGINPFTEDCIKEVYSQTGGIPREVLKACDALVRRAIERNERVIGVTEQEEEEEPLLKDMLRRLPFKQRELIKLLSEVEEMTPADIAKTVKERGWKYKSEQDATRSVNNILNRLMEDGYVERREWGKGYAYRLSTRTKNAFIQS